MLGELDVKREGQDSEVAKEESERCGDNPVSWNPAKGQVND